jgi:hypothetical membrane protein
MDVHVPLDLLNLLLAVVLPMLTALITARFANSAVKTLVLVALSVIAVALQGVFGDDGILHVREFIYTTSLQFLLAVGAHFGLLKPLNVTGARGVVANTVPQGIGGPADRPGQVAD